MSYSSLRVMKNDANLWLEQLGHVNMLETTVVKKHVFYVWNTFKNTLTYSTHIVRLRT